MPPTSTERVSDYLERQFQMVRELPAERRQEGVERLREEFGVPEAYRDLFRRAATGEARVRELATLLVRELPADRPLFRLALAPRGEATSTIQSSFRKIYERGKDTLNLSEPVMAQAAQLLAEFPGRISVSEIGAGTAASSALLAQEGGTIRVDSTLNPNSRGSNDGRYEPSPERRDIDNPYANFERVHRQLLIESVQPREAAATGQPRLTLANSAVTQREQGLAWVGARLSRPDGSSVELLVRVRLTEATVRAQKQSVALATLAAGRELVRQAGDAKDGQAMLSALAAQLPPGAAPDQIRLKAPGADWVVAGSSERAPVAGAGGQRGARRSIDVEAIEDHVDRNVARLNADRLEVRQIIEEVGEPLGLGQRVASQPFSSVYESRYFVSPTVRAQAHANDHDFAVGALTSRTATTTRLELDKEQEFAERRLQEMQEGSKRTRSYLVIDTHTDPATHEVSAVGLFSVREGASKVHHFPFTFKAAAGEGARESLLEQITAHQLQSLEKVKEALMRDARAFAVQAHGKQTYGNKGPYSIHLDAVQKVAEEFGMPATVRAAAYLHDVIEDVPGVDKAQIEAAFGGRVAQLVQAMTKTSKQQPLREYLEGIREAGPDAVFLKLADRLCNLRQLARELDQPKSVLFFEKYRADYVLFREVLPRYPEHAKLWDELDRLFAARPAPAPQTI